MDLLSVQLFSAAWEQAQDRITAAVVRQGFLEVTAAAAAVVRVTRTTVFLGLTLERLWEQPVELRRPTPATLVGPAEYFKAALETAILVVLRAAAAAVVGRGVAPLQ